MPLSDREQQILSEIESRLASEDARFAKRIGRGVTSADRVRLRYALTGIVIGALMLLTIAFNPWGPFVASAGFVLMLVCAVVAGNQLKRLGEDGAGNLGGQLRGGFSKYMEGRRGDE